MGDGLGADPLPVFLIPPAFLVVSAGLHEFQKTGVGHVVAVDGKRRDVSRQLRKFIVPSERDRFSIYPKRGAAGRDVDQFDAGGGAEDSRLIAGWRCFFVERKAVPYVQKRLLV